MLDGRWETLGHSLRSLEYLLTQALVAASFLSVSRLPSSLSRQASPVKPLPSSLSRQASPVTQAAYAETTTHRESTESQ